MVFQAARPCTSMTPGSVPCRLSASSGFTFSVSRPPRTLPASKLSSRKGWQPISSPRATLQLQTSMISISIYKYQNDNKQKHDVFIFLFLFMVVFFFFLYLFPLFFGPFFHSWCGCQERSAMPAPLHAPTTQVFHPLGLRTSRLPKPTSLNGSESTKESQESQLETTFFWGTLPLREPQKTSCPENNIIQVTRSRNKSTTENNVKTTIELENKSLTLFGRCPALAVKHSRPGAQQRLDGRR